MSEPNYIGEIICNIEPAENNPRNSEGAFIDTDSGEVLFIYSRFSGNDANDDACSNLYLIRSSDCGKSFSHPPEEVLTCKGESGINIMSVSLLKLQDDAIGLFYLVKETDSLVRLYLRRSYDSGKTWSDRVLCTPQQGCFVVNNDRVIRLSNGRLIAPAAVHRKGFTICDGEESGGFMDMRSDTVFFISDDDGKSWRISHGKCSMPYGSVCRSGLQEPGVLELESNILWAWARTDIGRQFEMYSIDGGDSWTTVQPSRFTSPCSPLSMKRMKDGKLIAIWNPVPNYNGRKISAYWSGGRNPLVYAVSSDNGKTFSDVKYIENDETHGYCYTAIHFTSDALLLGYCAGPLAQGALLCTTRIRRILISELLADHCQQLNPTVNTIDKSIVL